MNAGTTVIPDPEDASRLKAALSIQISTLPAEIDFAMEIAGEILYTSRLDDGKRMKEILQKNRSRLYSRLTSAGHMTAATRAMAGFGADAAYTDAISGLTYYQELERLERDYDALNDGMIGKLKTVLEKLLVQDGFLISFTGDGQEIGRIIKGAAAIRDKLAGSVDAKGGCLKDITGIACKAEKEGFLTPAKIQYVAQAGNFCDAGLRYTGVLNVLRVIMNYEYLWTNLRVIGGAYGCGATFGRNGVSAFYSYRDPHLSNTLQVYRGIADYLKNFDCDERDMTKYVIGTISGLDTPLTPRSAGARSMTAYLTGTTLEDIQKIRDEVLNASGDDIRALAPFIEAILKKDAVCVVGNEEKIQAAGSLFDSVRAL